MKEVIRLMALQLKETRSIKELFLEMQELRAERDDLAYSLRMNAVEKNLEVEELSRQRFEGKPADD